VEEHAEEAEGMGWVVERELFVRSGHVGNLVQDGERYWGIVRNLWKG
jgi:hypothetical protein